MFDITRIHIFVYHSTWFIWISHIICWWIQLQRFSAFEKFPRTKKSSRLSATTNESTVRNFPTSILLLRENSACWVLHYVKALKFQVLQGNTRTNYHVATWRSQISVSFSLLSESFFMRIFRFDKFKTSLDRKIVGKYVLTFPSLYTWINSGSTVFYLTLSRFEFAWRFHISFSCVTCST